LREAILDNKPIDIPKYVSEYCITYGVGDAPLTIESEKPSPSSPTPSHTSKK